MQDVTPAPGKHRAVKGQAHPGKDDIPGLFLFSPGCCSGLSVRCGICQIFIGPGRQDYVSGIRHRRDLFRASSVAKDCEKIEFSVN